jgi:hypothetical protein
MSTNVNTYIMRGMLLPYKKGMTDEERAILEEYMDSARSPNTNPKDGLTVLLDGMNGQYIAVGHVLAKTMNGGGFDVPFVLGKTACTYDSGKMLEIVARAGLPLDGAVLDTLVISHYR